MSDTGRQSLADKAGASMKPDSQKSLMEQMGDKMKSSADSMASTMQPQSEKSTTQKMGDTMSGNANDDQESFMDKTKKVFGM